MPAGHLVTGASGEAAAARLLEEKGYVVLERNWRSRSLELDLICAAPEESKRAWFRRKQAAPRTLVFVEVKTRDADGMGDPLDGLTKTKKERLLRASQAYLREKDAWDAPCRFDFISVKDHGGNYLLEHYEHVIEFTDGRGGAAHHRNAPWQPW